MGVINIKISNKKRREFKPNGLIQKKKQKEEEKKKEGKPFEDSRLWFIVLHLCGDYYEVNLDQHV